MLILLFYDEEIVVRHKIKCHFRTVNSVLSALKLTIVNMPKSVACCHMVSYTFCYIFSSKL